MADSNTKENKPGFFKTVAIEFKKIVWPSKEDVLRQSVAVTVIAIVVGILITIFDFLIQYGVNFITQ
ncbi:MAG: preprotein translocase subunit SecE [Lachnospiraceae bacterium]|jgi:preprotein translocase subunit SecE|nr:preprotein translocase subunit SecE [Lachnospiraceae bacterium]MBO4824971.1 preprotein translocase subunit SecE [Lachnospiraceae bacterium]MBR5896240.1 preprotein translocase subunit SecE [Lachnospiraceae bacterium]MCR5721043.1 preprotein translocase subunit SecE [Lachnospiraceae bacterium]